MNLCLRCTSCSEWHHRPCVISLDDESSTLVCERCQVSDNGLSWNRSKINHPLFLLSLKKRTHRWNATPFLSSVSLDPSFLAYDYRNNGYPSSHMPHYNDDSATTFKQWRDSNYYYTASAHAMGGFREGALLNFGWLRSIVVNIVVHYLPTLDQPSAPSHQGTYLLSFRG
jgi:hypothetical protein